jgi:Na+-translocating ferredoxin:NAD+ oxidoreductase RnfE subunit
MLTALVLVCSVAVTPDLRACTSDNARVVMPVPAEFESLVTCLMHGQAYLAGTSFGRQLDDGVRVKIVCKRSEAIAASSRD